MLAIEKVNMIKIGKELNSSIQNGSRCFQQESLLASSILALLLNKASARFFVNMKGIASKTTVTLCLLFLTACNAYKLTEVKQAGLSNPSAIKSFGWTKEKDTINVECNNQRLRDFIRKQVTLEFAKRGLALNQNHPDIMLDMEVDNFLNFNIIYYDYTHTRSRHSFGERRERRPMSRTCYFNDNSICFMVIDPNSHQVLWKSTVEGYVDNTQEVMFNLPSALKKAFCLFPIEKVKEKKFHSLRNRGKRNHSNA